MKCRVLLDLGTDGVIGAEALLRWNHPDRGSISPGEFIPVAESWGLIVPISRWLLSEVCHQSVAWQTAEFGELTVAMNCSAVQFLQGNLAQESGRRFELSGVKLHEHLPAQGIPQEIPTIRPRACKPMWAKPLSPSVIWRQASELQRWIPKIWGAT